MSRLNCSTCVIGCTDQESWVAHLLSSGHRTKQLANSLWNWPTELDTRALVIPCPSRFLQTDPSCLVIFDLPLPPPVVQVVQPEQEENPSTVQVENVEKDSNDDPMIIFENVTPSLPIMAEDDDVIFLDQVVPQDKNQGTKELDSGLISDGSVDSSVHIAMEDQETDVDDDVLIIDEGPVDFNAELVDMDAVGEFVEVEFVQDHVEVVESVQPVQVESVVQHVEFDEKDLEREMFYEDILNHFCTSTTPHLIEDFFVDTKWNVAVVLAKTMNAVAELYEKARDFPQKEEPMCIKSKYFLRHCEFETLPKIRLSQIDAEDPSRDSGLKDINWILETMKSAPLDQTQEFRYIMENYALTKLDISLQEDVFVELKDFLGRVFPRFPKVDLVDGGNTHFGYKFDALQVEIVLPALIEFAHQLVRDVTAASENFVEDKTGGETAKIISRNNPAVLLLRHRKLRILINLTIRMERSFEDVFGPKLIAFLLSFDSRAVPLVNFLQFWNTQRGVGLSNDTILNLVLVFLMKTRVIPSIRILQQLQHSIVGENNKDIRGGWDFSVCLDDQLIEKKFDGDGIRGVKKAEGIVNGMTYDIKDVIRWAFHFFQWFHSPNQNLNNSVLCLLEGRICKRSSFPINSYGLKVDMQIPMVTQHPFILSKNLSEDVDQTQVKMFRAACGKDYRRIHPVLTEGRSIVEFFDKSIQDYTRREWTTFEKENDEEWSKLNKKTPRKLKRKAESILV